MKLWSDSFASPIGNLFLAVDDQGSLRALEFDGGDRFERLLQIHYGRDVQLEAQSNPFEIKDLLQRYFEGELEVIQDIRTQTNGTDFQRKVWASLREISSGTTISYGDLAKRIENPAAVRAVGLANGANPISIVVPCHRVIGASGKLTGYGGGLERKRWLLDHERRYSGFGLF
jgi:methylated-DNA-[protein]-cysteine S-methyltransferase